MSIARYRELLEKYPPISGGRKPFELESLQATVILELADKLDELGAAVDEEE